MENHAEMVEVLILLALFHAEVLSAYKWRGIIILKALEQNNTFFD